MDDMLAFDEIVGRINVNIESGVRSWERRAGAPRLSRLEESIAGRVKPFACVYVAYHMYFRLFLDKTRGSGIIARHMGMRSHSTRIWNKPIHQTNRAASALSSMLLQASRLPRGCQVPLRKHGTAL